MKKQISTYNVAKFSLAMGRAKFEYKFFFVPLKVQNEKKSVLSFLG